MPPFLRELDDQVVSSCLKAGIEYVLEYIWQLIIVYYLQFALVYDAPGTKGHPATDVDGSMPPSITAAERWISTLPDTLL